LFCQFTKVISARGKNLILVRAWLEQACLRKIASVTL